MQAEQKDRLLNVEQVRERLQCSRRHVYNLVNAGQLPALKIGTKYGVRIRLSAVMAFIGKREDDTFGCN
jgi:excisionase family DNA binding protein